MYPTQSVSRLTGKGAGVAADRRRAASRGREDKKKSADTAGNENTVYSRPADTVCVRWWAMGRVKEDRGRIAD